jgi:hypothetical protein
MVSFFCLIIARPTILVLYSMFISFGMKMHKILEIEVSFLTCLIMWVLERAAIEYDLKALLWTPCIAR